MLVDSHCHIDFDAFDEDRAAVLQAAFDSGVGRLLNPAIDLASARRIVALAAQHPAIYAAVGVHPNDAKTWDEGTADELKALAAQPKVAAIGEIGLDYYRDWTPPEVQRTVLQKQLELAATLALPVIIHNRQANADTLAMLGDWQRGLQAAGSPLAERPGVLHAFAADQATADQAIQLHFMIGIGGPVTFRNAAGLQQIVAGLPPASLLIETDAPFLAPHPHRGQRNQPAFVKLIAEKIAALQARSEEEIAQATSDNAQRLFQWRVDA